MNKNSAFRIPAVSRILPGLFMLLMLPASAFAAGPAPQEHTARHEVDFMQHTLDHHLQSIRMSEVCTQNAFTPELIDLCTQMVEGHQAESEQLQAWLQEWYGEDHEPRLAPAQQDRVAHLQTLTEGEFERNYLQDMVPHHVTGIHDAAKCQAQFHHEELIDLCANSIMTQTEENRLMRTLLREGYGVSALEIRENPVAEPLMGDDGDDADNGDDGDADDTPDDGAGG